jgi:Ku protein
LRRGSVWFLRPQGRWHVLQGRWNNPAHGRDCHQRLKQQLLCSVHGKVGREQVVQGCEIEKDKFVVLETADLEAVKLETTHTIEVVQFIRCKELDPIYLDVLYFVGPDGPVSLKAYAVLREALRRTDCLALGPVVLSGREKIVALKPLDKGLLTTTLRYPAEIRRAASYFDDLANVNVEDTRSPWPVSLLRTKPPSSTQPGSLIVTKRPSWRGSRPR